MKPRLFIGSSSEALPVARAVQTAMTRDVTPVVWEIGVFGVGGTTLASLREEAQRSDFAVFVFQPDDVTKLRDKTAPTTRDNVVLEFGLFTGALGPDRVFVALPDGKPQHIPTDLHGITTGRYSVPGDEGDLVHELGAFCNEIRQIVKRLKTRGSNRSSLPSEPPPPTSASEAPATPPSPPVVPAPVVPPGAPRLKITDKATVFFDNRIRAAFPGARGIVWIENAEAATDKLLALLQPPLMFDEGEGYNVVTDPIWWFRGGSSLHIETCTRLGPKRILLNSDELEIERIAVLRTTAYWQGCVYVETSADQPIGLYEHTDDDRKYWVEHHGYMNEEYGLFDGTPITRECYDDGHAEIGGEVVKTSGADLRIRFLTKYNMLITSKFSPINSSKFDLFSVPLLNAALTDRSAVEALLNSVTSMLKHRHDE